MSQKSIVAIVIIVIVVALGVWWYEASQAGSPSTTSSAASTTDMTDQTTTSTGTTLHGIATQGGNYTCSISTTAQDGGTTGVIYAEGNKMRLDFTEQSGGSQVVTHTIRDGVWSYSWVDGQTTGTKTAITSTTPIVQQPQGGVIVNLSDNTVLASSCHAWSPDATQFVPPPQITFATQ